MSKPQLSAGALACILIMTTTLTASMNFPENYGMRIISMTFFAMLIRLAIMVPMIIYAYKYPSTSPLSAITERHKFIGFILGIGLIVRLMYSTVVIAVKMNCFSTLSIMPNMNYLTYIILLFTAAAYCVGKCGGGRNGTPVTMGKAAIIFCGILFSTSLIISVSLIQRVNLDFLYPSLDINTPDYGYDLIARASSSCELFIYIVLIEYTNNKGFKTPFMFIAGALVFIEFIYFFSVTTIGMYMNHSTFTFYMSASLSDVVLFHRLDGLDVLVWTIATVLKITVNTVCIIRVFKIITGKQLSAVLTCVACAVLTAFFTAHNEMVLAGVAERNMPPFLLLAVAIPLAAFIVKPKNIPPNSGTAKNTAGGAVTGEAGKAQPA